MTSKNYFKLLLLVLIATIFLLAFKHKVTIIILIIIILVIIIIIIIITIIIIIIINSPINNTPWNSIALRLRSKARKNSCLYFPTNFNLTIALKKSKNVYKYGRQAKTKYEKKYAAISKTITKDFTPT